MSLFKKIIIFALLSCLPLSCVGCTMQKDIVQNLMPTKTPEQQIRDDYKEDPAAYVIFSRSTQPMEQYVKVEDLLNYESIYQDCNGEWFKHQLSGEDLCIYNAYFYAMEHGYYEFSLYVDDNKKDFSYIRECVCLDSPFLSQNINTDGEHFYIEPVDYVGEEVSFFLEQFATDQWSLNMEAYSKCKEIVSEIPTEYVSIEEKMLYLYDYVCDNVEYKDYEDMKYEYYLYDAVCKGQTICDGYSNMLSLLFNLIGVECCEAMGSDIEDRKSASIEELMNNPGHTWVVAKLGDNYYNFDPTFEDGEGVELDNRKIFFGFSDELVDVLYFDLENMRPKCTDTSRDYSYADLVVENITDNENIKQIASLTDQRTKNGEYTTYVVVKSEVTDDIYDSFVDNYFYKVYNVQEIQAYLIKTDNNTIMKLTTKPW